MKFGVEVMTVNRARKESTDTDVSVDDARIGLDGKWRRMPCLGVTVTF
jgi:hypothetical protein